jgi:hypothetical protein
VDGFQYLRNRWYDPGTGRFTQEDPIGFAGGVNLYAYAGSNPVAWSDPYGLCPQGMSREECNRDDDPAGVKAGLTESDKSGGQVRFQGLTLNAIVGAGFTLSFGTYSNDQGGGRYLKVGLGVGLDVSAGNEAGASPSLAAFRGGSEAVCGGVWVLNGCAGHNQGGTTVSAGGAVGPTEILLSGHSELSNTFVSKAVPLPQGGRNPFDCGQPQPSNSVCNR